HCGHTLTEQLHTELSSQIEQLHTELSSRLASGHLDGSRELAVRLLDLVRARGGGGFLNYARALHPSADPCLERGEYELAEARYRRAINLYDALYGDSTSSDDHPRQLHLAACDLALNLENDQAYEDTFLLMKGLGVVRLAQGEDFPYYAVSQCHLA